MPTKYVFSDEAGCLTFSRKQNVSRFFIVCTVVMDDLAVGADLLALRKRLAWDTELGEYFHATTDAQAVRDEVFRAIAARSFTIQAQILEKPKAQPQVRQSSTRFYQYGWYYLFKFGTARELPRECEALITAASIGQRKERAAFRSAVDDVMRQTVRCRRWATDQVPAASDPCLQVADYCAWALQRKYERNDTRSYELIADKISYEFEAYREGRTEYY